MGRSTRSEAIRVRPVRTVNSNFVYKGPEPDIYDAWVERRPESRVVYLVWEMDPEERNAIARGAQIKLGIFNMEPIPPVSLSITTEDEVTDPDPPARIENWRKHEPDVVDPEL
jgi:hypothetical protein